MTPLGGANHNVILPIHNEGEARQRGKSAQQVLADLTEKTRDKIRETFSVDEQKSVENDPVLKQKVLTTARAIIITEQQSFLANPSLGEWPSGTPERIAERIYSSIYSLGPIDDLLELEGVEDIAINGPNEIYFRDTAGWHPADKLLTDQLTGDPNSETLRYNSAIRNQGKSAGPQTPIVDGYVTALKHRISIVASPVAADFSPCVVIRKHRETSFSLEDFTTMPQQELQTAASREKIVDMANIWDPNAIFTPAAAGFFQLAILAGLNILVLGRTGVGKTAFLSMLGSLIPKDRRVLVIEDTRELKLRTGSNPQNCVYFTTQQAQAEGGLDIPMHMLIKTALRQRPDHLVLGEARGAEMWDLLAAMQTGHDGNLTSIHAISTEEVMQRIEYMIMLPPANIIKPREQLSALVASSFHLVVSYLMPANGRRHIAEVSALSGEIEETSSGWQPKYYPVFLGGEGRNYMMELQSQHCPLEKYFRRIGHTYDEIVELEKKTKTRLKELRPQGKEANKC